MYPRILNYYLGMTLISALCQYPKHQNWLLNISHLVDMMTDRSKIFQLRYERPFSKSRYVQGTEYEKLL